ncbi:membrane protein [Stenotrophomonas humi]|uniref:Membrane protein n=1 Tax=Stenotrophomonas humi TaxID=405444 RepID=A0A0R0BWH0_9GAMM|nr:MFS transporter [Stenotrophomonas humi]KRG61753.1 membrane protein [Stenotrophomonas humi]
MPLPLPFSLSLRLLLAVTAGAAVANVYYAQPLLDRLVVVFGMGRASAGTVTSATQLGSVLALLVLLPLLDGRDRRHLLRLQLLALVISLLLLALAQGVMWLLMGMLLAGLFGTALTQGLIAYTASLAPAAQRGQWVGMVQGGVFIGLLLARVFSGVIAQAFDWQAVYLASALLMAVLAGLLWRRLPPTLSAPAAAYPRLLASMAGLLRSDRQLIERGVLALLLFAALNMFWAASPLLLSAQPLAWSTAAIGSLGFAGVVGALLASRVGYWADQGYVQRVSLCALMLMLFAWWPLSALPFAVLMPLFGIVLLDLGGQALHVGNQSVLLRRSPELHGRLIALYMLFYAVGSGLGAAIGVWVQARSGWLGLCQLGAGTSLLALLWWAGWRLHEARSQPTSSECRR